MLLELSTPSRSKAISLTPLIDVVFILLLFFMLSSSFSRWFAIDVSIPAKTQAKQNESLRVQILNDQGLLTYKQDVFRISDERLALLLQAQSESVILIDAENKVSTQTVVRVIDYLTTHGLENVSLGNTFDQKDKNG